MKIELRRITYNARLSEETAAYAADIWIDGKKRGDVKNDGHGGMDMIHPYGLHQEIDAYAKTLPPVTSPYGEFPQSAETIFGDILADHLTRKDLKRQLARKTLFVRGGKLFSMKVKGAKPNGDAVVLNDLPFDEAVTLFVKVIEGAAA
jgi:hypothetical protein